MFGPLGVPELLFILGLALLIFGPRKLPEIGRTLGKGMAEFRKASNELKRTLNAEVLREEIRENDPRRILRDVIEEPLEDPKPAKESAEPAKESAEPAKESAEPADENSTDGKPAAPEGTVSRSETSGAPSADAEVAAAEPDADALSSSRAR